MDGCVCLLVALYLAERTGCLMVGDTATGCVVAPHTAGLRLELDARCNASVRKPPEWVQAFRDRVCLAAMDVVDHLVRGLQYACREYMELLAAHGMTASMSGPANPYDNASCESFMKTLKQEEIHANRYNDLEHLRGQIAEFLDQYYNRVRLHSALGYRTPEEYERELGQNSPAAPKMSFSRHEEVSRSDGDKNKTGAKTETPTPVHRLDETPVGYSFQPSDEDLSLGARPWQVGLHQSPPPLHQPTTVCNPIS
jgi:hypothetical protein